MTSRQIRRLIRLHEMGELHASKYEKLSGDRSARPKALRHLRKAKQLYSQVSDLIRDLASITS